MPVSARELYDWHLRAGALDRLTPDWTGVRVRRAEPIAEGAVVTLEVPAGPLRLSWVARHRNFRPSAGFEDVQQRGPFAHWVHRHRMEPLGESRQSSLTDSIEYALPLGAFGRLVGGRHVRRSLRRLFAHRHALMHGDLERHRAAGLLPLRVAISGASGLVGRALVAFLSTGGHRVLRLVRGPSGGDDEIAWDPDGGRVDTDKLEGVDAVIHLAGENIAARRWSARQKERIRASRVEGTRLVAERLAGLHRPPTTLIAASAIGYYGDRGDAWLDERAAPDDGFLGRTCVEWEAAAAPAHAAGIRVVNLRIGVVLAAGGGALPRMLAPARFGLGGRLGNGRQYVSWIALDDLVGVFLHALASRDLAGPVNAVSPEPVTNAELTRGLARVLRRPAPLVVPAFAIRTLWGEMGQALLLASTRVRSARLVESGFRFRHGELEPALGFELGLGGSHSPDFECEFA